MGGNFENLAEFLIQKEKLVNALQYLSEEQRGDVKLLMQKMNRNQTLLGGAIDGLKSAGRRLKNLQDAQSSLGAYDQDGNRLACHLSAKQSLTKRA